MEAVRATQDVSVSDLAWKIDYDIQRCTLCGSCIAACTFGAIEAGVLRLERRDSQAPYPGLASGQASGQTAGKTGQNGKNGKDTEARKNQHDQAKMKKRATTARVKVYEIYGVKNQGERISYFLHSISS